LYKVAKTLRLWVIIVDNDTTACFNQMVEAPNNLTCLQHGADPLYIKLHMQTQKELRYHLKHKYGISLDFNTHQEANPWYGMGQGSGDGCNRWVIGTDSLENAYNKAAHQWTIEAPDGSPPVTQSINAFVNDVNLFIGKKPNDTEEQFLYQAQQDIHKWHGILRSTGSKLNTKKCFWSDFNL